MNYFIKICVSILFVLSSQLLHGQSLTVLIKDDLQKAIPNATVELYNSNDNKLIKTASTNGSGVANFQVDSLKNYKITAIAVGYKNNCLNFFPIKLKE